MCGEWDVIQAVNSRRETRREDKREEGIWNRKAIKREEMNSVRLQTGWPQRYCRGRKKEGKKNEEEEGDKRFDEEEGDHWLDLLPREGEEEADPEQDRWQGDPLTTTKS
jgi:hypothetical protein